jgi:hypothetical protein
MEAEGHGVLRGGSSEGGADAQEVGGSLAPAAEQPARDAAGEGLQVGGMEVEEGRLGGGEAAAAAVAAAEEDFEEDVEEEEEDDLLIESDEEPTQGEVAGGKLPEAGGKLPEAGGQLHGTGASGEAGARSQDLVPAGKAAAAEGGEEDPRACADVGAARVEGEAEEEEEEDAESTEEGEEEEGEVESEGEEPSLEQERKKDLRPLPGVR